ncbi:hypothetical protein LCGC14_2587770 [marine sediment metagenome]|uniref:Toprim domain-containing protein n=1 Tax=marine sediment metagenome TaxID=412755 RepID=A0A0F9ACZ5_9ZZZZ
MIRVSDANTKCPICHRDDWCLIAEDGSAAICSRIEKGSVKRAGEAGYLHILSDKFDPKKYEVAPTPYVDWHTIVTVQGANLLSKRKEFGDFCKYTSVNPIAALRFNIGYKDGWFTIPFYREANVVSGIQRRKGPLKRPIKHSKLGVFVPSAFFQYKCKTLAVTEGWSDAVAAIQYGLNVVGKFNSHCGDEWIVYYAKHIKCERVLIFADNDEHGIGREGAEKTQKFIFDTNKIPVNVVVTPENDLKDCFNAGIGLREML